MGTGLGIIGGGQLARMMLPICLNWDQKVAVLDQDTSVCRPICRDFRTGDFNKAEDISSLLSDCETVTMDLEGVSLEGLQDLEKKGVRVAPSSEVIGLIQNKYKQKQFFSEHLIPTAPYKMVSMVSKELEPGFLKLPTGGYDGKGVISYKGDCDNLPASFQKDVMWEERVDLALELSVLVVRNGYGEISTYETTEMVFDPQLNLIKYTLFPARITPVVESRAQELAKKVMEEIKGVGVLAVEMFLTNDGELLVNELAPRPHNSGHHTIETCKTSQFENHLRGVLGHPLGSCKRETFGLTFNLIGIGNGETTYEGVEELLVIPGVHPHFYGKKECRTGRKMGHVTITGTTYDEVLSLYERLNQKILVKGV
ncbi:MAG: ATP-grasp domain-containing protein [Bacteriovoracaceae bacterium]|nr:ATP-grasp domain-containing protein [Bacteriovoracaceae bacterium]